MRYIHLSTHWTLGCVIYSDSISCHVILQSNKKTQLVWFGRVQHNNNNNNIEWNCSLEHARISVAAAAAARAVHVSIWHLNLHQWDVCCCWLTPGWRKEGKKDIEINTHYASVRLYINQRNNNIHFWFTDFFFCFGWKVNINCFWVSITFILKTARIMSFDCSLTKCTRT